MPTLPLTSLNTSIQLRTGGTDRSVVSDYATRYRDGKPLPAIVVYHDTATTTGQDVYWLADGQHRVKAARAAGLTDLDVDLRQGDRRAAVLHATQANVAHGHRLTQADKRNAVSTLLADDEWVTWSDAQIADHVHVSGDLVAKMRKVTGRLAAVRTGKDGKARKVINTRAQAKAKRAAETGQKTVPLPPAVADQSPGASATSLAATAPGSAPVVWQASESKPEPETVQPDAPEPTLDSKRLRHVHLALAAHLDAIDGRHLDMSLDGILAFALSIGVPAVRDDELAGLWTAGERPIPNIEDRFAIQVARELADRLRSARTYDLHGLPTVARVFSVDLDHLHAAAAAAYPG
jgi:ParB-like chromosome segregation protein Spo0J